MSLWLIKNCRVEELLELLIAFTISQCHPYINLGIRKKAWSQLSIGSESQSIAGSAEVVTDRIYKTD
jgi:hypothetical protein